MPLDELPLRLCQPASLEEHTIREYLTSNVMQHTRKAQIFYLCLGQANPASELRAEVADSSHVVAGDLVLCLCGAGQNHHRLALCRLGDFELPTERQRAASRPAGRRSMAAARRQ